MTKNGDTVKIYQKPITKEDFEGYAVVRKIYGSCGDLITLGVTFGSDPEEFIRSIYVEK